MGWHVEAGRAHSTLDGPCRTSFVPKPRPLTMNDTGLPVLASKTTTPTGEVSTSASRSARARCLVAVGARIGDRGRGLGGEQHQHLFVFFGELLAARLLRQEEVADVHAPVTHRRSLERPGEDPGGCKAERADVVREVREPQRSRQVVQVLEQAHAVGPGREFLLLLRGEARGDGVLGRARLVDGGDDAVAGAGERPGSLHDLAQHGVEVEACADPQDRRAQGGDALAQRFVLPLFVGTSQGPFLPESGANHRSPRRRAAPDSRWIARFPASCGMILHQNL